MGSGYRPEVSDERIFLLESNQRKRGADWFVRGSFQRRRGRGLSRLFGGEEISDAWEQMGGGLPPRVLSGNWNPSAASVRPSKGSIIGDGLWSRGNGLSGSAWNISKSWKTEDRSGDNGGRCFLT